MSTPIRIATLLTSILFQGCQAHLQNLTPSNLSVDADRGYALCVNVSRGPLVLPNSIKVNVAVENTPHQMQGARTGLWVYEDHAPEAPALNYFYDLKWKYLFLFFPVSAQNRYPATGAYQSTVTAMPQPPGCTNDGWCSHVIGTTANIRGVWGSGPEDIFAVATFNDIRHYNGTSWSLETAAAPGVRVNGVWGSARSDASTVYAVGLAGAIATHMEPSMYWTLRWSGSDPTNTADLSSEELTHIWGSSPSNVFVVAVDGKISHFNGTTWSFQNSGTTNSLHGVWGSDSSNVFAVGSGGKIIHYDGINWTPQTSGTTSALYAVWGTSSKDVYAVGDGGVILRYDGASWNAQASGTVASLKDIWGYGPFDIYAVGSGGVVLHYNGSA